MRSVATGAVGMEMRLRGRGLAAPETRLDLVGVTFLLLLDVGVVFVDILQTVMSYSQPRMFLFYFTSPDYSERRR